MSDSGDSGARASEAGARDGGNGRENASPGAKDSGLLQFLLNLAMLVVFAALFVAAGALPDSRWEPLGSGTFPRGVLAFLMLLNLISMAQAARQALPELRIGFSRMVEIALTTVSEARLVIAVFLTFGLYLLALGPLGFGISTFIFASAVQIFLGPKTVKSIVVALILAAAVSFGLQYVFASVLNVFLPRGTLFQV